MRKSASDIDKILPQGEMLRGFMDQSYITKSNLFDVLRMRGVFTYGNDKSETIPILTTSLMSPDEFDFLREQQNTKEDNPKIITQHNEWKEDRPIIECLPVDFEINNILDLEYNNYQVSGSPNFVPIDGDPDHVLLDFRVERNDKAKNWTNNINEFSGSLELRKIKDKNQIRIVITHTATETKTVASEASKYIIRHFKNEGYVSKDSEVEKILFSSFTNPNRIEYFWSLTKNSTSSILGFLGIVDLAFSPDKKSVLPKGIEWMSQKIEDLILKGKSLQDTFFVQDKQYHDYILLYGIDCQFEFNLSGLTGKCVVALGFPDYEKLKNENSELEVNVKSVALDGSPKGINRNDTKKLLMKEIESQKIKYFDQFKVREGAA